MIEILIIYSTKQEQITFELQRYRPHNQVGPLLRKVPLDRLEKELLDNQKPLSIWLMTKSPFLRFPITLERDALIFIPEVLRIIMEEELKIYELPNKRGSLKRIPFSKLHIAGSLGHQIKERVGILQGCHCYVSMTTNDVQIQCFYQYQNIPYLIPIKYPFELIEESDVRIRRDMAAEKEQQDIIPKGSPAFRNKLLITCLYPDFWAFFQTVKNGSTIPYYFYTKGNSDKPNKNQRAEFKKSSGIDWLASDDISMEIQVKQYLLSYYLETKSFEVLHDFIEPLSQHSEEEQAKQQPELLGESRNVFSENRDNEPKLCRNWITLLKILRNKGFIGDTKDYQSSGVQWLLERYYRGEGVILADEMGLGKTLQVLLLIALILQEEDKILIITPSSLKNNWRNEVQKFVPELLPLTSIDEANTITIVSYENVRVNIKEFMNIPYKLMILDECQKIKNSKTQLWLAADKISAGQRILLTGTPIENSFKDLLNHLQFANNGVFPHQWEIISANSAYKELTDEEKLQVILCIFQDQILSRKKEDYLNLPIINEQVQLIKMEPQLKKAYSTLLEVYHYGLTINKGSLNFLMLDAILRLRQLCSDPRLVQPMLPSLDLNFESSKMRETSQFLHLLAGRHKVVFFATFIGVLDYFSEFLRSDGIDFARIDGSTESGVRSAEVDRFNNDENCRIFLCTLHTGGIGLNLTAADTVLLYNLWWNPAVENQAISRVHRMGQEKDVKVIKIIYKDSIEEKMMELIKKKQSLQDVFHSGNLSLDDFHFLLGEKSAQWIQN